MRWLLATLILLLAGCGSPAEDATPSDDTFDDFDVDGDGLVLKGVVVDQTIVPLEGATVRLGEQEVRTNDKGAFLFSGLEQGVYVVDVSKPGYHGATTTATVAGAEDPIIRVLLEADPQGVPFHEIQSVRGFLECGMGIPGGGSYSTCQTPIGVVDITCTTTGVCLGYVNGHRGVLEVNVENGPPTYAQAEAVWKATSANSNKLSWGAYSRTPDTIEFNNGTTHTGESPVIIPWSKGKLVDHQIGTEQIFVFQVFPESGGIGNLVLQQKVDLYLTMFYNYLPEDGWTLSADGEPVVPR